MAHKLICDSSEVDGLESRNAILQFDEMRRIANKAFRDKDFSLTEEIVLSLHECATRDIYLDSGVFRDGPVSISGTEHVPPPHEEVARHFQDMLDYVNQNFYAETALHLCSYMMWRLNWIHPFFDGNGRTTRAISYLLFVARLGYEPGGAPTWVDMIASDKFPYYDALDAADAADKKGDLDVAVMQELVSGLLAKQLVSIVGDAGG